MAMMEPDDGSHMETCDFSWPDADWCNKPKGHDGSHSPFGPTCGAIDPASGVACTEQWNHRYSHSATVQWPRSPSTSPTAERGAHSGHVHH